MHPTDLLETLNLLNEERVEYTRVILQKALILHTIRRGLDQMHLMC